MAATGTIIRFVLAAFVALFCLALYSGTAEASSLRISCDVYATNRVDPIVVGSGHLHRQIGNTGTTDSSTWESLRANKSTSCTNAPYLTSAGWWPVEQDEISSTGIIYYRAPGENADARALPDGIQLLAHEEGRSYNCGAEPLNATESQVTPPYGCKENWATHMRFPACWDGFRLNIAGTVYGPNRMSCPDSHPIRLIEVNFTITHKNFDGVVPNPLRVSCGVEEWCGYTSMHADYFFAAQDEVNHNVDRDGDGRIELRDSDGDGRYEPWQEAGLQHQHRGDSERNLVDLCARLAPDSLAYNNSRCRADGLLDAHVRELKNYY